MKPYLNPPKVSNIIAQNLLKAIILHTFEVQVGPKPREGLGLRAYMTWEGFGAGSDIGALIITYTILGVS